MSAPSACVAICTHNPRPHYLQRVIDALKTQSAPYADWELLIVDNGSARPVSQWIDLAWHPSGRIVSEPELGLTPARLRAIAESASHLLIFVDDDNIAEAHYIERCIGIASQFTQLGAWGAGRLVPQFERAPPDWIGSYLNLIGCSIAKADHWSNNPQDDAAIPCGAGLCVRRTVAQAFASTCTHGSVARFLDRRGSSLLSGGDTLLALMSRKEGFGFGRFVDLEMLHLIPPERTEESYLLRMAEQMSASQLLVRYVLDGSLPARSSFRQRLKYAYHAARVLLTGKWRDYRFRAASARGYRLAASIASTMSATGQANGRV